MSLDIQSCYSAGLAAQMPVADLGISQAQLQDRRELVKAVRAINQSGALETDRELSFAVDTDTRRPVIRIIDRQTQQVISQIPPEQVLHMASTLSDQSGAKHTERVTYA